MAIQEINVGGVANDGTGDDLREAMIKVNENFNELDLRQTVTVVGSNLGAQGVSVYKEVENGNLKFRRLVEGDNITLVENTNNITISAPDVVHNFDVTGDTGTAITITDTGTISVTGGRGIQTSSDGTALEISSTALLQVADDPSPRLSGDLSANGNNILNIGYAQGTFRGPLDGLVYGYDMRNVGPYFDDFDFGDYSDAIDTYFKWFISSSDVDLGTFAAPETRPLNFGTF